MKGKFDLEVKFDSVLPENRFISEMTLAELKFGVENSEKPEKNKKALDNFLIGVQILPIFIRWIYTQKKRQDLGRQALQLMILTF